MYRYLFELGRKPEISIQEIRSVFKDSKIIEQNSNFLILTSEQALDLDSFMPRLGGTIKIGIVLEQIAENQIIPYLTDFLIQKYPTESKIKYGLNLLNLPVRHLNTYLIGIKKALKKLDRNCRFINKNLKNPSLPALLEEGFLKNKGSEILIGQGQQKFWLAETKAVQDIDKYSLRDYQKPFRDAKMGMLPPKLAQILINLTEVPAGATIWDPFCGSGTILMEGLLMGLKTLGSDKEPTNVEGSQQNLWWLCQKFQLPTNYTCFVQDVLQPFSQKNSIDAVVCEGYLGKPKRQLPEPHFLFKEIGELENLYTSFFQNLKTILPAQTPIVIALPCFKERQNYIFLENILEKIKKLGYSSVALSETKRGSLIYDRKDQVVAREICKLIT